MDSSLQLRVLRLNLLRQPLASLCRVLRTKLILLMPKHTAMLAGIHQLHTCPLCQISLTLLILLASVFPLRKQVNV
uniref:Uncharacterized protein n=1 Tax=uncultured marine virus TaxID=186617 RepID=A0A0F7LCH5_9VIRU|nr:hypothetical protein [uncultured marine virus]